MTPRHRGQVSQRLAHVPQAITWPHGKNTWSIVASMQIRHVSASMSLASL